MNIIIAGDVTAKGRIGEKLKSGRYDDVLADIAPVVNQADYAILNLETPVVEKKEYHPIAKVGPCLSAPAAIVDMVKQAGFDAATLANNHILDYGPDALKDTVRLLDEKEMEHVGAGKNLQDASEVLFKQFGEKKLAVINFCETEFSVASEEGPGAFPLDIVKNVRQIQYARANADYVVVIVHGGIELYPFPTPRMKELYRFYVDMGADAVVNHHQHCYSGYEVYQGKPVFYGLGNLCMDSNISDDPKQHVGFMVNLSFSEEVSFELIPYRQCDQEAKTSLMSKEEKEVFIADIARLNEVIDNDSALRDEYAKFIKRKTGQVFYRFSPYSGKVAVFLAQKGILKVEPNKKQALRILEYLTCDSHRDIARNVFDKYLEK